MPRVSSLLLALSLLTIPVSAQSPSTPVDVAYVRTFSSLQTYNVDPNTGIPTAEGPPLALFSNYPSILPSPDDHFLYLLGQDIGNNQHIWVYTADLMGVPLRTPIQILDTSNIYQFEIDPSGKFAYASEWMWNGQQNLIAKIRLFTVNPKTGLLGKDAKIVATSQPNGPCGTAWSQSGMFFFDGFNSDGSQLYYHWDCGGRDYYGAYYYSRRVAQRTGKVGPQRELFAWGNSGGAGDSVSFTKKSMIDFYNAGGGPDNAVNIYPPTGGTKPLFSCYVTMLQACGEALTAFAEPAGEYLFLQISADATQIAKIDMAAKKIVDTGNYIPQQMWQMSPDRILIYSQIPNQEYAYSTIYVFNPATGAVQQGGAIEVSTGDLVPALRQ